MTAIIDRLAQEPDSAAPMLLVSFRNRDALANEVADAGWQANAARRIEGLEKRFLASRARVILIDARAAVAEGLATMSELSDAAEISGAALLVIADRDDEASLDRFIADGATHVLLAPYSRAELVRALRLAERHALRVSGQRQRAPNTAVQPRQRDALTGLSDASAARGWIGERLGKVPLHVLLVAISRFEMINAAFGLETGDSLLRNLAHRIEPLIADFGEAMVARIAGAEFAVLLPGEIGAARIGLLTQAIVDRIERPFSAGTHIVRLGARVGVVAAESEDGDATQLLRRASGALAEAKLLEGERIVMQIGDRAGQALRPASLHADLRAALHRDEIDILFQPQVSVSSGAIIGVEALARWRHPEHGELGATTLFTAAEQSDYLIELSTHVQQRALRMAAGWSSELDGLRLSINVTTADIARHEFVQRFVEMVDASGFPRARLTVEVTESGLMEDLGSAATILADLRAAGCRVAIDDFGTGYSSLAYLKALPLDYLKIDRSLTTDIVGSSRDSIVVRGVIDMARALGLAVIAEGVETDEQLSRLAREGCTYYQGFLCAEPLDGAALLARVTAA